jgi:Flp pilus assembly protein CpaB
MKKTKTKNKGLCKHTQNKSKVVATNTRCKTMETTNTHAANTITLLQTHKTKHKIAANANQTTASLKINNQAATKYKQMETTHNETKTDPLKKKNKKKKKKKKKTICIKTSFENNV